MFNIPSCRVRTSLASVSILYRYKYASVLESAYKLWDNPIPIIRQQQDTSARFPNVVTILWDVVTSIIV